MGPFSLIPFIPVVDGLVEPKEEEEEDDENKEKKDEIIRFPNGDSTIVLKLIPRRQRHSKARQRPATVIPCSLDNTANRRKRERRRWWRKVEEEEEEEEEERR